MDREDEHLFAFLSLFFPENDELLKVSQLIKSGGCAQDKFAPSFVSTGIRVHYFGLRGRNPNLHLQINYNLT
jgi:hypothetical protein